MSTAGRRAFLIDADNVAVELIEQALDLKEQIHGPFHIKRCYCSAEFALRNLPFLQRRSIRAMVNVTAGKNCNDIALAIDAVLLCQPEAPELVVIVGSDSDFAPIVMHLRDRGSKVEGVGQAGKTGVDSPLAYDEFVVLPIGARRGARASSRAEAAVAMPVDVDITAPTPAPASARTSRGARSHTGAAPRAAKSSRATKSARAPAPPALVLPDDVAAWLEAVPELASGESVELKVVAEPLRKAKLLSKSGASPKLFKKQPDWFELLPEKNPSRVRFIPGGRRS